MEIALYFGGILGSIVLGLFWYNRKLVASKVELEAQLNTYKKTDEYKEKVIKHLTVNRNVDDTIDVLHNGTF